MHSKASRQMSLDLEKACMWLCNRISDEHPTSALFGHAVVLYEDLFCWRFSLAERRVILG